MNPLNPFYGGWDFAAGIGGNDGGGFGGWDPGQSPGDHNDRPDPNDPWEFLLRFIREFGIFLAFCLVLGVAAFCGRRDSKYSFLQNFKKPTCSVGLLANQKSEKSEQSGNGKITKKEEVGKSTTAPFLSLSSYIIPIYLPGPDGYYVINIQLNDVVFFVLAWLSNHFVSEPLVNYLIEDWHENFRKEQLVDFLKDIRDHSVLLQIDFLQIVSFYVKLLQGPRYYSDWVKKEELLHEKKNRIKALLDVRSIGPAKVIFTRHGPIHVWLRNYSMRSEIKNRSKFQTKNLERFFNKTYRELLDRKLPLGATFELGPSFKNGIKQSFHYSQLLYSRILGSKDYLRVDTDDFHVKIFFDPMNKEMKIETFEPKTQECLIDCFVGVLRIKLADPQRIKLAGPQPNSLGFGITVEFEQRASLTLRRKFAVVFFAWYLYRNRRYL